MNPCFTCIHAITNNAGYLECEYTGIWVSLNDDGSCPEYEKGGK